MSGTRCRVGMRQPSAAIRGNGNLTCDSVSNYLSVSVLPSCFHMPPGKRRRVDQSNALHVGGVSITGLADLLRSIAPEQAVSSTTLRRANHAVFNDHKAVERMQDVYGGMFEWSFLAPDLWLGGLVGRSAELQAVFEAALNAHPVSPTQPWRLVLGFDEFTPGNKLQLDNRLCIKATCAFFVPKPCLRAASH